MEGLTVRCLIKDYEGEGISSVDIWEKSIPGRGIAGAKNPETECLANEAKN